MANRAQDHGSHSRLVRFWKPKKRATINPFGIDWAEGEMHTLKSPFDGYYVGVSFSCYPDHPEYVRIRSTNWRAEHEPRGIFFKEDARAFYRMLKDAGFVKPEPPAEPAKHGL